MSKSVRARDRLIAKVQLGSVIEWIDGWTDYAENENPGGTFFLVYENARRDAVFCANSVK
jgi:hypothetical protein